MADQGPRPVSGQDKTIDLAEARVRREEQVRSAGGTVTNKDLSLADRAALQEQLLRGGVKLMTDILATARPEVFQKATKVQRWARRLAKSIQIDRVWELDLAALLYPLGVISLPDDLAAKYASDLPLDSDEAQKIEESALVASRLIANIPQMEGVARAVFYARKGFDGSGWPQDGPSGQALPQAARILKILIDLADAATGPNRSRDTAFQLLSAHRMRYDPQLFAIAQKVLRGGLDEPAKGVTVISMVAARPGDVLIHDLVDANGRLLLSAGTQLTELSARRLASLASSSKTHETITVSRGGAKPVRAEDLPREELF